MLAFFSTCTANIYVTPNTQFLYPCGYFSDGRADQISRIRARDPGARGRGGVQARTGNEELGDIWVYVVCYGILGSGIWDSGLGD